MENKTLPITLLLIAVLLGAFYRSFLLHAPLFYASDELYHYSVARNAVENGFVVQQRFVLSGYPNGTLVTEPKGLYYIAIIPYFFLRNFVSLMDIMRLLPLIFGVVDIVLIFLIARKVFDEKTAIISAFLLAASVANIQRTAALVYRGDGFMPLFFLVSIYLLIEFFEKQKPIFAFGAAIFLSFCSLVWNGATFGYLTFALSLILLQVVFFLKSEEEKLKQNFWNLAALLFAFLLYNSYKIFGLIYEQPFMHNFPLILLSMLLLFFLLLLFYKWDKRLKLIFLFFVCFLSLVILIKFYSDEIENVITGYGLVKPTSPLGKTIAELQAVTLQTFFVNFGIFFPFMFIGVIFSIPRIKENEIILLTFFSTSFFLAVQSLRFSSLLSYPFAIFAAFGFVSLFNLIFGRIKNEIIKNNLFFIFLIPMLFVYYFDAYPLLQGGNIEYNSYWDSAMKWLGNNSPPNSGVIIWWNEGTMVELLAHRAAYIDSVGAQNEQRITLFSELMLSPPKFNATLFKNFKNNNAPVFLVTSPIWMWQIANWLTMTNKTFLPYGFVTFAKVTPNQNFFVFTSDDGKWNVFFNITDAWLYNGSKKLFIPFVVTNYTQIYKKEFDAPYTLILLYNSSSRFFEGGFLVTKQLANTTYIQLQFYCTPFECFYPFKQIYSNQQVKIFYVDPSAFSY